MWIILLTTVGPKGISPAGLLPLCTVTLPLFQGSVSREVGLPDCRWPFVLVQWLLNVLHSEDGEHEWGTAQSLERHLAHW